MTAPGTVRQAAPDQPDHGSWWRPLVLRLHFYVGVFVGPFLLMAAMSGALYALSPQLEPLLYERELQVEPTATTLPLAEQIEAARTAEPDSQLLGVRPAPEPGDTTRVLFDDGELGESEALAVFVDPGSGQVRGELTTYGTSGALPVRSWIDQLHRSLHLGDAGRLYSELAASWLWVLALGGVALWASHLRRGRRPLRRALLPDRSLRGRARSRSLHGSVGLLLSVALLGLSITGLTWSTFAGANVTEARTQLGWDEPALSTTPAAGQGGHEGHTDPGSSTGHEGHTGSGSSTGRGADPATYDGVLAAARQVGIDSGQVEILAATEPGQAWTVTEIDRSWPTQVDATSVDPGTLDVVDQVRFADHPFMAKMARWGIDAHMGSLFGLPNQLLLAGIGIGLAFIILWGYRMWWQRRPTRGPDLALGRPYPRGTLRRMPWPVAVLLIPVVGALAWFLPLMGVTLAAFLGVDALLGLRARRARAAEAEAQA